MDGSETLSSRDQHLVDTYLKGFLPDEVYDIHAHPYEPSHFGAAVQQRVGIKKTLGAPQHRAALLRYMPTKKLHGLYFGYPSPDSDRAKINDWVAHQARDEATGTELSHALYLVAPGDDKQKVATELKSGRYAGLKVYHSFSSRPDTMNATVEEYAPDWMWELLNETNGLLMLHIVLETALLDPANQKSLRRLCRAYPKTRLILAHISRSFNYRHARYGLHAIADLENAMVDTSAVAESEAFRAALKILGPKRVLWGSDFFISEQLGRCVSTGLVFFWLSPESIVTHPKTTTALSLIGIESLLCLREACDDAGLTAGDLEDIFRRNALRVLAPHLPKAS